MDHGSLQATEQRRDTKASTGLIATLDAATFGPQVLEGSGPIAVEFMSYSCSHCGRIEPLMRTLAVSLSGRERIFRVNVAREQTLAERYAIQGTPTLIMFLDGRMVGRVEGPDPTAAGLQEALTRPYAN